jgi:ASC-1-like (ASCH) protein
MTVPNVIYEFLDIGCIGLSIQETPPNPVPEELIDIEISDIPDSDGQRPSEEKSTSGDFYDDYLAECKDENCVFNREKHMFRSLYEDNMKKQIKAGDKVLFFNSFHLLQECILLEQIDVELSEIHIYDKYYVNYDTHTLKMIFTQFCNKLIKLGHGKTKVYVHYTKESLKTINDINVLGAVDYCVGNDTLTCYQELCWVARTVLKEDGLMIACQHWNDQVDVRTLKRRDPDLLIDSIIEYVKPSHYESRLYASLGNRINKNPEDNEYIVTSNGKVIYALIKFEI